MTRFQQQFKAVVQAGLTAGPQHSHVATAVLAHRGDSADPSARVSSFFTHLFKHRNPRRVPLLKPSTFVNFSSSFPNILFFFFLNLCSYLTFISHHCQEHKSSNIILLHTSFWSLCFSFTLFRTVLQILSGVTRPSMSWLLPPLPIHLFFPSGSLPSALALCPAIRTP